jgi:hypothetical protein
MVRAAMIGPGARVLHGAKKRKLSTRAVAAAALILLLLGGGLAAVTVDSEDRRTMANSALLLARDIAVPDFLERQRDEENLIRVREDLLARHLQLRALTGRELAVALRDIAHREIEVGTAGGGLEDAWQAYDESVRKKSASHACQGINTVFRIMLAAFGFETRGIALFAAVEQKPGEVVFSHATTDVRIDGTWEAIDATYNFSLRDAGGRRMNWASGSTVCGAALHSRSRTTRTRRCRGAPSRRTICASMRGIWP